MAAHQDRHGGQWWVDAIARVGVPSALLIGIVYVIGNFLNALVPDAKDFLRSAARQLDIVSESVPKMQVSLEQLVKSYPALQFSVDRLEVEVRRAMNEAGVPRKGG